MVTAEVTNGMVNRGINPGKQVQAMIVGRKAESELKPDDRKYYGAPEYRGMESSNSDGTTAYNVNFVPVKYDFQLKSCEATPSNYRRYCQDMFYRKFMGYDAPYFKAPTDERLIAIHDECARDAGYPELCIQKPKAVLLPDNKMSASASAEQAKAEAQHPADDNESIELAVDFISYAVDRLAPVFADDDNELMKKDEFKNLVAAAKEAAVSFIRGELNLQPLYDTVVSAIDLDNSKKTNALRDLLSCASVDELLQKLHISDSINSMSDKVRSAVITLIKTTNERPLISAIADIVVSINSGIGNSPIETKDVAMALAKNGDELRQFAAMFRKDRMEDASAVAEEPALVTVEVVDDNGNTVSTSEAVSATDTEEVTSIIANVKAANDTADKTASEKREERKRKKMEKAGEVKDDDTVSTYIEKASDGSEIVVDEDRYNNFENNHKEFLKQYPGIQGFLDILRDDQKCKFFNYYGLLRASVFRSGQEKEECFFYIDPGKIRPGYGIIIPRNLDTECLDPLTDIRCSFENAKLLVQFNQYTQADYARDNAATMPNLSYYEHVQYDRIPEADRPYVVGILKQFTDTLSSMGLCLRFKPINYKSKDVFTLACNTKVGLSKFAKHNHLYNGLEIDIHCVDNRFVRLDAHGKNAGNFAMRVNEFVRFNMIGLGIEARELDEKADQKIAERVKTFGSKVVNNKKNKTTIPA